MLPIRAASPEGTVGDARGTEPQRGVETVTDGVDAGPGGHISRRTALAGLLALA